MAKAMCVIVRKELTNDEVVSSYRQAETEGRLVYYATNSYEPIPKEKTFLSSVQDALEFRRYPAVQISISESGVEDVGQWYHSVFTYISDVLKSPLAFAYRIPGEPSACANLIIIS